MRNGTRHFYLTKHLFRWHVTTFGTPQECRSPLTGSHLFVVKPRLWIPWFSNFFIHDEFSRRCTRQEQLKAGFNWKHLRVKEKTGSKLVKNHKMRFWKSSYKFIRIIASMLKSSKNASFLEITLSFKLIEVPDHLLRQEFISLKLSYPVAWRANSYYRTLSVCIENKLYIQLTTNNHNNLTLSHYFST